MRIIVIALCVLAAPATRAQAPAPAAADESAVRAVIQSYVNAREARDGRAIDALVTRDADQYTTAGQWRRGPAELTAGMAESSRQNPGTRAITVASVRFITPDVAIADGGYDIAGSAVRRWTTIVLEREAGAWRIAAIRNMVPGRGAPR
jgi:uncharacterized protein (TIGR02246 family)